MTTHPTVRALLVVASIAIAACSGHDDPPAPPPATWKVVHQDLPGALLSVWGTSATDVWTVGADARDGTGPLALHWDGTRWSHVATGQTSGDLWWVFGFAGGPVFLGGAGGVILRCQSGACAKMATPGTNTVFGLWGASKAEMWAVGGNTDRDGFAWRLAGDAWVPEKSLPAEVVKDASIWKVFGKSADDAWLVGANGVSFHWNGAALERGSTGVATSLFTVHANAARYAAVGGLVTGVIVENDGAGWKTALDTATFGLTGVALGSGESGYAVGQYASVYVRDGAGWHEEDTKLSIRQDLHSVWIDPEGSVWAVGGQVSSFPLTQGVLIHKGGAIASGGI